MGMRIGSSASPASAQSVSSATQWQQAKMKTATQAAQVLATIPKPTVQKGNAVNLYA